MVGLMSNRLWISWEDHRRSRELAKEFGATYHPILLDANRFVRYPILSLITLIHLIKLRPSLLFCQNPSIVLTSLLVIVRPLFRFRLIVDRHSNFKIETIQSPSAKWRIFHFLSRMTIRKADLTIVTNQDLKELCEKIGGRAVVLQDKIPELRAEKPRARPEFMKEPDKPQIMFVTMFDPDEPINEIVEASRRMPEYVCYLTGNYKKVFRSKSPDGEIIGTSTVFTGFVSDEDYLSLMENSDLVVVLTKKDLILNCGAYEAISFDKPLILSNTQTLKDYFGNRAIYTDNNPVDLSFNINYIVSNLSKVGASQRLCSQNIINSWNDRFEDVNCYIESEILADNK